MTDLEEFGLKPGDIEIRAVRARGPGGQNVNKVASAVALRLDIPASGLPEALKRRLLGRRDRRIGSDGTLVIKAQRHRTQERNRADALARLGELLRDASTVERARVPTRVPPAARRKRMEQKQQRASTKALRRRPERDD